MYGWGKFQLHWNRFWLEGIIKWKWTFLFYVFIWEVIRGVRRWSTGRIYTLNPLNMSHLRRYTFPGTFFRRPFPFSVITKLAEIRRMQNISSSMLNEANPFTRTAGREVSYKVIHPFNDTKETILQYTLAWHPSTSLNCRYFLIHLIRLPFSAHSIGLRRKGVACKFMKIRQTSGLYNYWN